MIHLDINGVIKIKGNGTLTDKGNGNYLIHLSKDAEVVLYKNEKDLLIKVGDVKQVGEENYWGKKLNKQE
jgi:hypothetical protein